MYEDKTLVCKECGGGEARPIESIGSLESLTL